MIRAPPARSPTTTPKNASYARAVPPPREESQPVLPVRRALWRARAPPSAYRAMMGRYLIGFKAPRTASRARRENTHTRRKCRDTGRFGRALAAVMGLFREKDRRSARHARRVLCPTRRVSDAQCAWQVGAGILQRLRSVSRVRTERTPVPRATNAPHAIRASSRTTKSRAARCARTRRHLRTVRTAAHVLTARWRPPARPNARRARQGRRLLRITTFVWRVPKASPRTTAPSSARRGATLASSCRARRAARVRRGRCPTA